MTRFCIAIISLLLCTSAIALAEPVKFNVGKTPAQELGVEVADDEEASAGGYWKVQNDFEIFLSPKLPRGEVHREDGRFVVGLGLGDGVKISDIEAIRYSVRTAGTPYNVNVMLALYTEPGSDPNLKGDDETWYQRRAASEPLYCRNYKQVFPVNRWGVADTAHKTSPMLFFDTKHSPPGFSNGPTLAILQSAGYAQTWRDLSPDAYSGPGTDTIAYGQMVLKYISLSTYKSEGNWKDFKGDLDTFTVELKSGQSVTVDFAVTDGTTLPPPKPMAPKPEPVKPEPAKPVVPAAPKPVVKPVTPPVAAAVVSDALEPKSSKSTDNSLWIALGAAGLVAFGVIVFLTEKKRRKREATELIAQVRQRHAPQEAEPAPRKKSKPLAAAVKKRPPTR